MWRERGERREERKRERESKAPESLSHAKLSALSVNSTEKAVREIVLVSN